MKRKMLPFPLAYRRLTSRYSFGIVFTYVLFTLAALVGCAKESNTESKKIESVAVQEKEQTKVAAEDKSRDVSDNYYTELEIHALGFRVVKLDEKHSLLCSNESDRDCVCLESLPSHIVVAKRVQGLWGKYPNVALLSEKN